MCTYLGAQGGYYIKDYHVDIDIKEDGSIYVTEDIDVFFTEKRRGIIRDIPIKYKWNGKLVSIKISDIQVPDHKTKKYRKKGKQFIRIGKVDKYITGDEHYTIKYKVKGALADYGQFQEFYWDIIPNNWDTEIKKYSYKVNLPSPIELTNKHYRVLSGRTGSQDNSSIISYADGIFSGRSTRALNANEGVTLGVELPAAYVDTNLKSDKDLSSINSTQKEKKQPAYWSWLLGLLGMGGLFQLYRKFNTNNEILPKNIKATPYPPDNMSAAQVGVFIDHQANTRDIIALIPQWGAEGFVKLEKTEDDTIITKLKDLPENMPKYEHTLFEGIFNDSCTIALSDLKYELAGSLSKAKIQLKEELMASDLYDKNSQKTLHSGWTIAAALLLMIGGVMIIILAKLVVLGIMIAILGMALFIIYFLRPKYSATGSDIIAKLKGLESFLDQSSGHQYDELLKKDPKYFDKIYPYAVALGLDKKFLKTFNSQTSYQPHWYYHQDSSNGTMFTTVNTSSLADSFDVEEIGSVFGSVRPSESGGSGGFSSSGGSVGGGFGGGGGSSW